MGYTTEFNGQIEVAPPLNAEEIEYLQRFAQTCRMKRKSGPYTAIPGSDGFGQDPSDDIINYNEPGDQPGLWCQWVPTEDGRYIEWDGGEKFYNSPEWMKYIIDHFLRPGALAKAKLPFLQANHDCNGAIYAQGEDPGDLWTLFVRNNKVSVANAEVTVVPGTEYTL